MAVPTVIISFFLTLSLDVSNGSSRSCADVRRTVNDGCAFSNEIVGRGTLDVSAGMVSLTLTWSLDKGRWTPWTRDVGRIVRDGCSHSNEVVGQGTLDV